MTAYTLDARTYTPPAQQAFASDDVQQRTSGAVAMQDGAIGRTGEAAYPLVSVPDARLLAVKDGRYITVPAEYTPPLPTFVPVSADKELTLALCIDGGGTKSVQIFDLNIAYNDVGSYTRKADLSATYGSGDMYIAQSPDGVYIAVVDTEFVLQRRTTAGYTASGITIEAHATSTYLSPTFNITGTHFAMVKGGVPKMYSINATTNTFTALTFPDSTTDATSIALSRDATYVAVGRQAGLRLYKRSGATLTRLTDPATLPTHDIKDMSFSPNAEFLSIVGSWGPPSNRGAWLYARAADTFVLHPTNPFAQANTSTIYQFTQWSLDGRFVTRMSNGSYQGKIIYKVEEADAFTLLPDQVGGIPNGVPYGASWSPGSGYILESFADAPYWRVFELRAPEPFYGYDQWMMYPLTTPAGTSANTRACSLTARTVTIP